MFPRRHLPSLSSLLALEALDRLGTATAAAAELALTQGAISKQLQVLEGWDDQGKPILRATRPGDTGFDGVEIDGDHARKARLRPGIEPEPARPGIGLDQSAVRR